MKLKDLIRNTLNVLRLDLTKNLEYDRLTKDIMKRVIKSDSNCIDVGCHKGEILESILKLSPEGTHYGFEPIPSFYTNLKNEFGNRATILPFALSNTTKKSSFQYVKNDPAYSGIQKRKYAIDDPQIEEIEVEVKPLDEVIPEGQKIDFIKIDVEGGEFDVLKGGERTIASNKPIIIFECGIGASDYYGTNPKELYEFVSKNLGLNLSLLKSFISNQDSLSQDEFEKLYSENKEYYFVAHAK